MFRYIVRLVGPDLAKEDTNMRKALSVEKRIAVTLWRLAMGDTYRSTALQFGVGRATALKAKQEFCKILANKVGEFIIIFRSQKLRQQQKSVRSLTSHLFLK